MFYFACLFHDESNGSCVQIERDLVACIEMLIQCSDRVVEVLLSMIDDHIVGDTFHAKVLCMTALIIGELIIVHLLAKADVQCCECILQLIEVIVEAPDSIFTNKLTMILLAICVSKEIDLVMLDVHAVSVLVIDIDAKVFSQTHNLIHDTLGHGENRYTKDTVVELSVDCLAELDQELLTVRDLLAFLYIVPVLIHIVIDLRLIDILEFVVDGLLNAFAIATVHDEFDDLLDRVALFLVLSPQLKQLPDCLTDPVIATTCPIISADDIEINVLEGDLVLKLYHVNDHPDWLVHIHVVCFCALNYEWEVSVNAYPGDFDLDHVVTDEAIIGWFCLILCEGMAEEIFSVEHVFGQYARNTLDGE